MDEKLHHYHHSNHLIHLIHLIQQIRKIALTLSFLALLPPLAWSAPKPFLVVIDPGHGGTDHGASVKTGTSSLTEKDVTLSIAKQVQADLRQKGIRSVLTRSTDSDVPLAERTALANRLAADVFISIHVNSSPAAETASEGVETYILNNSTDLSSKRLADLENSVLQGSAADLSAQSEVALIVKDLMLDANLHSSKRLACLVQNHLVEATSTPSTRYRNRGVKQALFYVLLGADMPSVLVEAGFLNNARDRMILSSAQGQLQISRSLVQAIHRFRLQGLHNKGPTELSSCKIHEHPLSANQSVPKRLASQIIK